MQMESGDKYRRRSSEKRIGVFTDSGNAGYLGGSGARLPPLCGARIEAIVGNDLSLRATAEDIKRHVVVKAKKRRPSIPNVDEVTDDKLCSHGVSWPWVKENSPPTEHMSVNATP